MGRDINPFNQTAQFWFFGLSVHQIIMVDDPFFLFIWFHFAFFRFWFPKLTNSISSSSVCQLKTENLASPVAASRLKLYSYWRSSCSHRVRIALNLKGLSSFIRFHFYMVTNRLLAELLVWDCFFYLYFFFVTFLGLNFEYKAVNLLKGEQFTPGNYYAIFLCILEFDFSTFAHLFLRKACILL